MPVTHPESRNRFGNFDDWAALARTDPEAFERRRREVIESFIESTPEAHREQLRRLQWRIDTERNRAPTPLAACIRISAMMWESVTGEHGLLATLEGRRPPPRPAQLLIFRRKNPEHA